MPDLVGTCPMTEWEFWLEEGDPAWNHRIEAAIEWNSEPFQCDESELIDVMLKEKLADLKLGMHGGKRKGYRRECSSR